MAGSAITGARPNRGRKYVNTNENQKVDPSMKVVAPKEFPFFKDQIPAYREAKPPANKAVA